MPVLLALLLGFQQLRFQLSFPDIILVPFAIVTYTRISQLSFLLISLMSLNSALAMLAGVVSPPIILGGAGGANLSAGAQQYLVSTSLVVCGILSAIQITRFHIWGTPYVLVSHGPVECGMDGAFFPLRFLANR